MEMMYWVCPKGKRHEYGEIATDFKTMLHYYLLFTNGDDKAEVWYNDYNYTDEFLKLKNEYFAMHSAFSEKLNDALRIPIEEK